MTRTKAESGQYPKEFGRCPLFNRNNKIGITRRSYLYRKLQVSDTQTLIRYAATVGKSRPPQDPALAPGPCPLRSGSNALGRCPRRPSDAGRIEPSGTRGLEALFWLRLAPVSVLVSVAGRKWRYQAETGRIESAR